MHPNQEVEHRHVVVNTPGERRETITETTQEGSQEFRFTPGMVAAIAIIALIVIGLTMYVVSNKNANEEANRQALLQASQTAQPQQQAPAPAQQPIIIQQPAPQQAPPVILQQPAVVAPPEKSNPLDDTTIQDAVTKRLADDASLASVSAIVIDGKATLTGTVDSSEGKLKAEKVARAVRGVKSVDNKIEVANQ